MSTLQVNVVKHPDSSSNTIKMDLNDNVTVTGQITQTNTDSTNLWSDINSSPYPHSPMDHELTIRNDALDTANSAASIFFRAGQTTAGMQINSARIAAIREAAFDTSLAFSTRAQSVGHTEKMRITSDGNVGIGTSSPATTLDVNGTITDDVSNVRTPRRTAISADTTIADEGVYYCTSNPTLTLGAPAVGAVMTIYNNSASTMTLNRGSTVTTMRKGADNDTTNNTSLTLGAYSTTTITMFQAAFALVTGTDVT